VSCGKHGAEPHSVDVAPLYDEIQKFPMLDSADQQCVIQKYSVELEAFMKVVSGEPFNVGSVESWASSRAVEVFTPLVDSVFKNDSPSEVALSRILANAEENALELPRLRYAEIVYGRPESVLFVDSVMLIALNHYLGANFDGYSHLPAYMRLLKTPEMLPYDLAEALVATSYPYDNQAGATLLSRLLYEGALVHAKLALVDRSEAAPALGYTDEQLGWLEDNEKELWNNLVSKGLLFDTSESAASRLVSPAPSTHDLIPGSPGRAGRYIGYKMVQSYLRHHDGTSVSFLLSSAFYADSSVLEEVSYNP